LAVLAEIQHRCGTTEDAPSTFEKVRALSAALDADLPPFQRLESLARACGHEGDWRIAATTPTDVGHRPDLDSLGPFRWSPSPAPPFHAVTGDGKPVALADYNGRPVLVVFFLGFDCLHCVEQLQALAPHITAFKDAGIDIVTLGTCTQEQIRTSTESGAFPLPILADPNLTSFRRWRVFDDFEKIPLHGTFLLDASHHVRWRDIAFEPFMDIPWLLEESRRLLALPATEPAVGASTGGGSK
jgi:peroxiredoxin